MFTVIEEADLLLSDGELVEYLDLWRVHLPDEEFRIFTEVTTRIGIAARRITMQLAAGSPFDATCIERMRYEFCDYLERHVFDQWELDLQEFLMQVCIVEEFDWHLAEIITGRSDVESMINRAEQMGNFLAIKEVDGGKIVYEIRDTIRLSMRRRIMRMYQKDGGHVYAPIHAS